MPCHPVANRKNTTTAGKSKTPGTLIYNVPGSRSGGIPLRAATNIVVTPHWGDHSLFVEKGFDEISATGGHRILSPRPFQGLRFRNPDTKIAKPGYPQGASRFCCRSGGIRTRGLLVPNQRFGRFFRLFPLPSGIFRQLSPFPVFSACFPVFPRISKYFLSGHSAFLFGFYRYNHPMQLSRLQHIRRLCLRLGHFILLLSCIWRILHTDNWHLCCA